LFFNDQKKERGTFELGQAGTAWWRVQFAALRHGWSGAVQRGKRGDTKADLARIWFLPRRRPEAGPLFLLMKPLVAAARRPAVGICSSLLQLAKHF
jgi:hypothetical protein